MSNTFTFEALSKQTVTKLREIALGLKVIQGVHGMNKAEVLDSICELKGIEDPNKKEAERKKSEARASIKDLKTQRKTLQQEFHSKKDSISKDDKKSYRKQIKKLRQETRRLADV
ncbi:hypothetical protein K8T06_14710 [bacterium]|nr:hypothetical protein [bacterium]